MINTLKYARKLEEAGFSRQQAEANIQIIAEIVEDDVATKQDLKELEYRLVVRISTIVGGMITFAIAVTAAIAKIL
jgi:hypothetical protein